MDPCVYFLLAFVLLSFDILRFRGSVVMPEDVGTRQATIGPYIRYVLAAQVYYTPGKADLFRQILMSFSFTG